MRRIMMDIKKKVIVYPATIGEIAQTTQKVVVMTK